MRNICHLVICLFGLAYIFALALLVVGTFGLFGSESDPISGVYLIPLGLPWNLFLLANAPEVLLPWVGIMTPLLNFAILIVIYRWFFAGLSR